MALMHSLDCVYMFFSAVQFFAFPSPLSNVGAMPHIPHRVVPVSPCQSLKSKVSIVENSLKVPQLIQWHLLPTTVGLALLIVCDSSSQREHPES